MTYIITQLTLISSNFTAADLVQASFLSGWVHGCLTFLAYHLISGWLGRRPRSAGRPPMEGADYTVGFDAGEQP